MTSTPPGRSSTGKYVLIAAVVAFMAVTGWVQLRPIIVQKAQDGHKVAQTMPGIELGGPFTLTGHTGQRVSDDDFRGEFMLIYFGYTYCPDVCPTELSIIADALDAIGPLADRVRPILISVDPERDTPEVLADYVRMFHPRMVGLTGSVDEIAEVARKYRAYFAKAENQDPDDVYLVDHSSLTYLMGPDGKFLTTFSYGAPADMVAAGLTKFITQ